MKGTRQSLTTAQVVKAYEMRKSQANLAELAREIGVPENTVMNVGRYLPKYITQPELQTHGKNTYKRAAAIIRARGDKQPEPEAKEVMDEVSLDKAWDRQDRYGVLEQAFETFSNAIADFVEAEVKDKHEALVKENEELKSKNEKFVELVDQAKNSNWVDVIRKRLQQPQ